MSKDATPYGPRHAGEPMHAKTWRVAQALGIKPQLAYGYISAFRAQALIGAQRGELPGGAVQVEHLAWWDGEPGRLADAFAAAGVVDVEGGVWSLHEDALYNGMSMAARSSSAERMRKSRERKSRERKRQESEGEDCDVTCDATCDVTSGVTVPSRHLSSPLLSSDLDPDLQRGSAEGEPPPVSAPAVPRKDPRVWFAEHGSALEREFPDIDPVDLAEHVVRLWPECHGAKDLRAKLATIAASVAEPPPIAQVPRPVRDGTGLARPRPISRMGRGTFGIEEAARRPKTVADLMAQPHPRGGTCGDVWAARFAAFDGKGGRDSLETALEEPLAHWLAMDNPWPTMAFAIPKIEAWLGDKHTKAKRDRDSDERTRAIAAKATGGVDESEAARARERADRQRDETMARLAESERIAREMETDHAKAEAGFAVPLHVVRDTPPVPDDADEIDVRAPMRALMTKLSGRGRPPDDDEPPPRAARHDDNRGLTL